MLVKDPVAVGLNNIVAALAATQLYRSERARLNRLAQLREFAQALVAPAFEGIEGGLLTHSELTLVLASSALYAHLSAGDLEKLDMGRLTLSLHGNRGVQA